MAAIQLLPLSYPRAAAAGALGLGLAEVPVAVVLRLAGPDQPTEVLELQAKASLAVLPPQHPAISRERAVAVAQALSAHQTPTLTAPEERQEAQVSVPQSLALPLLALAVAVVVVGQGSALLVRLQRAVVPVVSVLRVRRLPQIQAAAAVVVDTFRNPAAMVVPALSSSKFQILTRHHFRPE